MSSRTFIKHCTDFRTKRDPFVNSHCVTLNYRQLSKCSSNASSSSSCVLWCCYWMVVITGKRRVVDKQIVQVLQWLPLLVGLADPCPPPPPTDTDDTDTDDRTTDERPPRGGTTVSYLPCHRTSTTSRLRRARCMAVEYILAAVEALPKLYHPWIHCLLRGER